MSNTFCIKRLRRLCRVFDHSGCEHSASFESVNMQNKHGHSIQLHDCYLKRCVKNSLVQYSFYSMESRVSSSVPLFTCIFSLLFGQM